MAFDISKLNEKLDLSSGEWIDDIPDNPGLRLKVRSQRYKFFKVAHERLTRKYQKVKRDIPDDEWGAILADHILVDWDASEADGPIVLKQKGKIVPYSPELAKTVLTAEDDHGIGNAWRLAVTMASNELTERNLTATEDAAKN